jgi:hypothetical protein
MGLHAFAAIGLKCALGHNYALRFLKRIWAMTAEFSVS